MKIRGRNALNANIIRRLVFDFDEIRATSGVKAYPNNGTVLNRIKELSDDEQRKEVLEMFLSGDTIHTIIPMIKYNNKWYIRIEMSSDRLLDLRLKDTAENRNLIRTINNKYKQDRYLKLLSVEYDSYLLRDTKIARSYYVKRTINELEREERTFDIELLQEDESVYELIKAIIDKELINKGIDVNTDTLGFSNTWYSIYDNYKVGNKKLEVSSKYSEVVNDYIDKLLKENVEAKKLQMKMEGF